MSNLLEKLNIFLQFYLVPLVAQMHTSFQNDSWVSTHLWTTNMLQLVHISFEICLGEGHVLKESLSAG